jgi:arylsulfatase A-like enzyme
MGVLAVKILLLGLVLGLLSSIAMASAPPMNIILILSDDVGAETIGSYGGQSYQTPQLDQMAADGIRFEYGHAQPLCTPSRVKVMTGKYNFRNYRHFSYLDPTEKTFAHLLQSAGYNTTVVGKWQLYNQRFEDVQGAMPGDAGFDDYLLWQLRNEDKGSRFWGPVIDHNGESTRYDKSSFGPDIFNDYVLNYIEEHTEGPFFIYYPMVLAHDPWVTTPDMRDESASDQEKFAAMMAYMDKLVGNVLRKVEEEGMADRTVVFFIGDNGTGRDIISRYRGRDVRGAKGATIDAGTRVPFLAWGPGVVEAGGVSDSLVNLNDILPTLAGLAGVGLPADYPGDGVSLLPMLRGESELNRENIFIHYEPFWPTAKPARYALDRRWKLYEGGGFFDMEADPLEKTPLDVERLEGDAATAYQELAARIESMPGELQSRHRWIPRQAYYLMAGSAVTILMLAWLLWRVVRYFGRRRASATN